ncbi:50S ribosomal protein L10 [Candidatus Woesearchaeota archaeon]|nr:50S ribosomal protein L10 [Candidatus Woesearchaeota archaeon]
MSNHISEAKKNVVKEFADLIDKYDVIGAVNMENLPAKQLHNMRVQLRDTVLIKMSKRRLLKVALEQSKKQGVVELLPHLKGMPALLFTNSSPFTLFKTLKKNKSKTGIKGGQIAPNDIIVPAGPTSFAPGPVIGELGSVGIKAGIDGGKVAIKADAVVAKEGDEVSQTLAGLLTRLGIEPMEIGLDLTAVCENGEVLTKAVLDIDEDQYISDVTTAASWAFNLAIHSAFPTTETTPVLIQNAFADAKALAISEDILTDLTVGDTLAKAHNQMMGVVTMLPDEALSADLKGAQAAIPVVQATQVAPEDDMPEEKKDDKKDEPDAAAGLGALFG